MSDKKKNKIRVPLIPNATEKDMITSAVNMIREMKSYGHVIRILKLDYGLSFSQAVLVYEKGVRENKLNPLQLPDWTKEDYIELLLDIRQKCIDSKDLDNEIKVAIELGKRLYDKKEEVKQDNDILNKEKELTQQLLEEALENIKKSE